MKKYLLILLTIFALNGCEEDTTVIDAIVDKKLPTVDVCHYDAYTDTWGTISINENALKAHLAHGDFEGSCEETRTLIPDSDFENFLIYNLYDDVLDGSVLTKNIAGIKTLNLPYDVPTACGGLCSDISDITGIEDFISLEVLKTGIGLMTSLDLSTLTKLESLQILSGQFLETLDISTCSELQYLYLGSYGSPFALLNLDVSNNIKLKRIDLVNLHKFEGTDFSNLVDLERLTIDNVKTVPIIDLSNSVKLNNISLNSIQGIDQINLKNGYNNLLTNVYLIDLNYITQSLCVQVDDPVTFASIWTNVDSWTSFSEDCGY